MEALMLSPARVGEGNVEPDAAVVERVRAGEREAYSILVLRYQEGFFRYALGMVGSPDAAADLVQETLVKGFVSLERCREPERFGAWAHRILRNRCLDYLKDRRRRNVPLAEAPPLTDLAAGPEGDFERRELRDAVLSALETLPDAQREAFLLKHLEERPYEEMSELLGVSVSALKMRVKRAREAIQSVLQQAGRL
jgi:RNA polymerase sigma factor (sigma-70 family)